ISLPEGLAAAFRAEVVWARKLRGPRPTGEQNSMGLRFLEPPDRAYGDFLLAELRRRSSNVDFAAPLPPAEPPASLALPADLEGRTIAVVSESDLACPDELTPAGLAPPRAAAIMEEAVDRALAPYLDHYIAVGVAWDLSVEHSPPTPPGTPLVA